MMRVIIVGAGIGGLATALQLHRVGIECEVYEQSEQIRELVLWPDRFTGSRRPSFPAKIQQHGRAAERHWYNPVQAPSGRTPSGNLDTPITRQTYPATALGVGVNALPHAVKELAALGCQTAWTRWRSGPRS